ncbi:MAG: hypothetical protein KDJ86_07720 [Bauldia sp.]|uniref:hypothetical protein n=1 Tax=Bauldia sp. TaxID=2575872 RepID=UPI001D2252FE|nr:hypothetical protein [Bauldia sp.]MCB1495656.1 hypothetical protein [Bauldia sp.]
MSWLATRHASQNDSEKQEFEINLETVNAQEGLFAIVSTDEDGEQHRTLVRSSSRYFARLTD